MLSIVRSVKINIQTLMPAIVQVLTMLMLNQLERLWLQKGQDRIQGSRNGLSTAKHCLDVKNSRCCISSLEALSLQVRKMH